MLMRLTGNDMTLNISSDSERIDSVDIVPDSWCRTWGELVGSCRVFLCSVILGGSYCKAYSQTLGTLSSWVQGIWNRTAADTFNGTAGYVSNNSGDWDTIPVAQNLEVNLQEDRKGILLANEIAFLLLWKKKMHKRRLGHPEWTFCIK